jgi:hypothetical protein
MPAHTIVSIVTGFRVSLVGLFTGIVGVPADAVSRMLLWLPDCTAVELDPRPQYGGPRPPSTAGGLWGLVCTPNATRAVVSVLLDTSSLPPPGHAGNTTNDVAVEAVTRVFANATHYAIMVHTLWEAAVNTSSGPSARSVDLLYADDSSSAPPLAASGGDDGPDMFAVALALGLVAVVVVTALFLVRNGIKCRGPRVAAAAAAAAAAPPGPGVETGLEGDKVAATVGVATSV